MPGQTASVAQFPADDRLPSLAGNLDSGIHGFSGDEPQMNLVDIGQASCESCVPLPLAEFVYHVVSTEYNMTQRPPLSHCFFSWLVWSRNSYRIGRQALLKDSQTQIKAPGCSLWRGPAIFNDRSSPNRDIMHLMSMMAPRSM
jgi:hypothetical protein